MVRSAQELQSDLNRIQVLIHKDAFLSLSREEKERLFEDSQELVRKLGRVAESSLVVGLLGGTGVGKSSLMNALACSPIAATSHRRPHTDQVLIYHHAAVPLPDALNRSPYPWREITHEAEAVRHLLLCDLPDFDSLLTGHRERVVQFLEHLDILVWTTTPEKYADERFYAFLREVPKARQNFYFILNKVDLLFPPEEPETGYAQLASLITRFSHHLRENGILQPVIYAVSAREGCDSKMASPWNHFWNFRNQIFRLHDAKEVREIKAANLDVEAKQLTHILEKEVQGLNILYRVLTDSACELETQRSEWAQIGHAAFHRTLERSLDEVFERQPVPTQALVGVGSAIARVARDWKRLTTRPDEPLNIVDLLQKQGALETQQHELQRLENKIIYQSMHQGLPPSIADHCRSFFDANAEWSRFLQRLQNGVTQFLENHWPPPFSGFIAVQYATYLTLLVFLLIAISGDAPLWNLFERPSWFNLAALLLALIRTLFSPQGLAALGSYLLLQVFLGFRFYGRYKKLLQQHAQKFIESLKLELSMIWEEELNILITHLTEAAQQVEGRIEALSALCPSDTKD